MTARGRFTMVAVGLFALVAQAWSEEPKAGLAPADTVAPTGAYQIAWISPQGTL